MVKKWSFFHYYYFTNLNFFSKIHHYFVQIVDQVLHSIHWRFGICNLKIENFHLIIKFLEFAWPRRQFFAENQLKILTDMAQINHRRVDKENISIREFPLAAIRFAFAFLRGWGSLRRDYLSVIEGPLLPSRAQERELGRNDQQTLSDSRHKL